MHIKRAQSRGFEPRQGQFCPYLHHVPSIFHINLQLRREAYFMRNSWAATKLVHDADDI